MDDGRLERWPSGKEYCFSRRQEFSSQHPGQKTHNFLYSSSRGPQHPLLASVGIYAHMHTHIDAYIHII